MGKLVRLELFNFKSYKGHHVLLFGDSYFTSIIGPNGSGKSNSMDAISFVLGIKSSQLRSSQLRDLVYRGRVLKHATINEDGSATTVAQPGRQFAGADDAQERNDPKSAWVMAVYEDDAGDEMTWKRTINSQGSSEYRINNKVVNAQQYNQALESENILIKARNFLVFQGDVEAIASQSPRDLTRLLEQISGSIDFKPEYERLKEAQEIAFENQNYSLNKRRGINSEIKQYQEQKKEADTYSRKLEQRDQAVVKQVLWKLYQFQQVIEKSQTEIQKQQEELQDYRRGLSQHEEDLHSARREHEKAERDSDKNHRAIKAKEREILEKENSIVPIAEKTSYLRETQINIGGRIIALEKQMSAKNEALSKLRKDIELVGKAQSRWEASWREEGQQQGRILNENDLSEYSKLKETVTNRLSERQTEADNLMRQVRADKETLHSLKSALDMAEYRQKRSEAELEKLRTDRQTNIELSEEIKGEMSAKRKQTNTLVSSRRRNIQTRNELEEKLQECLSRLLDAEDGRQQSHKEAQMKALISDMKRIFPGVRARVGDLCKPKQKKYSDAVVTVLGRNFDSVIVDDEKTAKECMQYLRDQRRGQATFIPLDTIQVKPVNGNLKGLHKGTRMAIDVLEYDKSLDRAMSYACGNAVICDDLATAKFICFEKAIEAKAVTLDGTIIHKGGLMTGGRGKEQTTRRFEDAELDNLRKLAEDLRSQLQNLPDIRRHASEEERLQGDLTSLDQRLREAFEDEKSLSRNIESAEKRILQHGIEQNDMQTAHQERDQRLQRLVQRLKVLQSTISEVEDQVFANFCQRLGFSNIRQYESSQGSIQQEAQERRLEYQHQHARLHARLTREEQEANELDERIQGLKGRLKSVDIELARFEAESQRLSEASDRLSVQLHELNERLQRRQSIVDKKAEIVMQHKREVQKRSREVEGAIRNINESKTDLERGFVERYGLLRRCKLEDINIPLKAHSRGLDQLPIQTFAQTSDAMDIDTEADVDAEPEQVNIYDHGIDIDFDKVEDLSVSSSKSIEDDLLAKISAIDEELRSMAPNMRAIERLEGVESRLKSTEKEFEEARKRAKQAKDGFQEVREKRLRSFRRAFNHISEQIDPIYKELTRSTATPMGGQAYLDQEDSDEPYLDGIRYHAMPPLKRFRDMEHLSGGEKTIAALALLFAVHSYQPSPFFVLDEVDAALDNANVARIGNYIKQHAGPGMQFIVISLKTSLFQTSEALIGIHRDQTTNTSKALTLDV